MLSSEVTTIRGAALPTLRQGNIPVDVGIISSESLRRLDCGPSTFPGQ